MRNTSRRRTYVLKLMAQGVAVVGATVDSGINTLTALTTLVSDSFVTSSAAATTLTAASTLTASATTSTPASTGDSFTGTNGAAVDSTKWNMITTSGSSVTIQNNAARFQTGNLGSYGDKAVLVSKQAARLDGGMSFTVTPSTSNEAYFQAMLRAQTSDTTIGDNKCYRLEMGAGGTVGLSYRVNNSTNDMGSTTIAGFALGTPVKVEFTVVGSLVQVYAWTGTTRPSTPTFSINEYNLSVAGAMGLVLNGGAPTTTATWSVDDWALI